MDGLERVISFKANTVYYFYYRYVDDTFCGYERLDLKVAIFMYARIYFSKRPYPGLTYMPNVGGVTSILCEKIIFQCFFLFSLKI